MLGFPRRVTSRGDLGVLPLPSAPGARPDGRQESAPAPASPRGPPRDMGRAPPGAPESGPGLGGAPRGPPAPAAAALPRTFVRVLRPRRPEPTPLQRPHHGPG
ncbi:uncharacterized protein LOC116419666 [Sarcophilus harrisii]|uniref:uncharacterized protein LOC116419666 n=1 Tax=Sarcophilus harrisii TaxID=9305 RepID=UPI001301AA86|nr:uncharacterized protein LOC116419666 [Sarcophilus harrisii]